MHPGVVADLLGALAHLVWPCSCPVCGAVGVVACPECLVKILEPPLDECLLCGGGVPCASHPGAPWLRTGGSHEGVRRDLVLRLKYGGERRLGREMGQALARVFPRPEVDVLVPVPLHSESKRLYNQASVLAEGMGRIWDIPAARLLEWSGRQETQTKKHAAQRRKLDANALRCRKGAIGRVLLVDDVCTTGSTLRCAAECIRSSGGRVIGALTWSRSG